MTELNQVQETTKENNQVPNKAPRQKYVYELIGTITEKKRRKPSTNNQIEGKKYDDYFYQLNVVIENKDVNKIFVFKSSLATENI